VTAITATPGGIEVQLSEATTATERFDAVLVAIDQWPSSRGLGLETIGLTPDAQGFLAINGRQQTAVAYIYAVGDLVGEPMLTHKPSHQGRVAAEVIPAVAYTSPEVAWVGLTEREAAARGLAVDKGKFPWGANGRALTAGVAGGVTKALSDPESGRLLDAGICAAQAGACTPTRPWPRPSPVPQKRSPARSPTPCRYQDGRPNPAPAPTMELTLDTPLGMHLHRREGAMLELVAPFSVPSSPAE
jgi:pyruvate/2-oxoglutarate dehydrogenase complex dihydrolipoamide dehydrogenase (E3) component